MSVLGSALLIVSLIGLAVYSTSLAMLLLVPASTRRGLARTALCRMLGACVYLAVAVSTLLGHPPGQRITLALFIGIQGMWLANSAADVHSARSGQPRYAGHTLPNPGCRNLPGKECS